MAGMAGSDRSPLLSRLACSSCTTESAAPSPKNPVPSEATNTWMTSQYDCRGGGSGDTAT